MIKADKLIPGGQAIGTNSDGKKVFFWNAVPGELIEEFIVTKNKAHYTEAIATKIKNPSTFRVAPNDECYLSTSPWQIMSYEYELKNKQELVKEMFREQGIAIDIPEIITDHRKLFYRNKMEYSLYWDNDKSEISLAFHLRGTHKKIPINNSSIERKEIFHAAKNIVNELNAAHEEARKYQSLLLRCDQAGEVSGGLFEKNKPHPTFENLIDTILEKTYSYSPNGFFQINLPVYSMALKEIQKNITTKKVLDLYAGVGTIGLSVAPDKKLTLVEVNEFAYKELINNIYNNESSNNITGLLRKSEDVLDLITTDETVILDPPRAGCEKKLIERIIEIRPKCVIYLSCNPITQARDIKPLLDYYKIKTIKTYNFFPRTPHIENLVILEQ